ncbi:unnamed protein product [Vitrella brassicaformis CCMP3155]|uniref:Uncharacterized protein n=1 Tax=Vitrella brassicaformis (strain CCMP3155) TaxID=1169540 RepID=A0A0G4EYX9_VITBC|nr:unnamed protein product [Vitrella brassicaformis CCMP3155]|eukprot:CEM04377.1 unnamed protein product [Vitrella brassicaformis CCMP3155]
MCCGRPMCWSRAATSGLAMGRFIRLAAIYRLTPANGLPLVLSAQRLTADLSSRTAFHQLPLAMAIYKIIGRQLPYRGTGLALQQIGNDGLYRIGNVTFRVVPLGELPGGHRYADGYKRTDPVIRWSGNLFPSFSAFLLNAVLDRVLGLWCHEEGEDKRRMLWANIGSSDPRFGRLLTDAITEEQGIAVDFRYDEGNLNHGNVRDSRYVIVSGFRPSETVAAYLVVCNGRIHLYTTEASAADRSHPLADRFRESVGAARRLLRRFGLESDVIDRGTVVG